MNSTGTRESIAFRDVAAITIDYAVSAESREADTMVAELDFDSARTDSIGAETDDDSQAPPTGSNEQTASTERWERPTQVEGRVGL